MPPGGAPAAPAAPPMPAAPRGPEAGPSASVPKPIPEAVVSMSPVAVAERQGLASQMGAASSPDSALAAVATSPAVESTQADGAETQQTPGQKAFAEFGQLGIVIDADTKYSDLVAQLQAKGWDTTRQETQDYIGAGFANAQVRLAREVDSQSVATEQVDQAVVSSQTAEQAALNQPAEATIRQALKAMGKADTPENREEAKRLIAAKAEADAKAVVEKFGKTKEKELLPEEQMLMEGMSKLIAANPDEAQKWLDVLAREDPAYFKWLNEKLDVYTKQEDARKSKYYTAAGIMGFLMFIVWNVATNDGQH